MTQSNPVHLQPNAMIGYACSISEFLRPVLNTDLTLTRLSTHTHACNLVTPDNTIIALVALRHGHGPFHIVIPDKLINRVIHNHSTDVVSWQQGCLRFGRIWIDLSQAVPWNPRLPLLRQLPTVALPSLYEITKQFPSSALETGAAALTHRAQQGKEWLQSGILQADSHRIADGVGLLAGLGPGLTPAGDDFLVGLLVALHSLVLEQASQQTIGRDWHESIAEQAARSTTRLSAAWLRHAGQGRFGETWHYLINALNRHSADAITAAAHRILTTGASSGVDAMSGFLFGVTLLQRINDR